MTPTRRSTFLVCAAVLSTSLWVGAQQNPQQNQPGRPNQGDQNQIQNRQGQTRQDARGGTQHVTAEQFVRKAAMSGLKEVHAAELAQQKAQDPAVKQFAQELQRDHQRANQRLMQIAQQKNIQVPPKDLFAKIIQGGQINREYVREGPDPDQEHDQLGLPERQPRQPQTREQTREREPGQRPEGAQERQQVTGSNQWQVTQSTAQELQRLQSASGKQFDLLFVAQMNRDHAQAIQRFEMASQQLQDAELKQFASETLQTLRQHKQKAMQLAEKVGTGEVPGQREGTTRQPGQGQQTPERRP